MYVSGVWEISIGYCIHNLLCVLTVYIHLLLQFTRVRYVHMCHIPGKQIRTIVKLECCRHILGHISCITRMLPILSNVCTAMCGKTVS